jgi:hypothetical protein
MLWLIVALGTSWFGYSASRRFVRDRLRYVDAAQKPGAAIIAAIAGAIALSPAVWLLPAFLATSVTAVGFGLGVGLGARAGATDIKRGYLLSDGSR